MSEDVAVHFVNFRPARHSQSSTKARKHGDFLKALTINLVETYSNCSADFGYVPHLKPRRVLTKLSKAVHNSGYDNAEHDYICRVKDKIKNPDGQTYSVQERLGHGTFGQVLKCQPSGSNQFRALKIIKNKPAYFLQALLEVRLLMMLNRKSDPDDKKRIVRMLDFFVYRKHLCIVFELLSYNLYDVLKQNSFRGVSTCLIRVFTQQLLEALECLREAFVIHCDLKPENVLLRSMNHVFIKLIDFGSACFANHTVYSYIQSRFYRSPEVLLGLPYTSAIDMWSLGCICAELYLGLPIFPGHSEYDQVCRISEVMGLPPTRMLDAGKTTRKYFRRVEEPLDAGDGAHGPVNAGSDGSGSAEHPEPESAGELPCEGTVDADERRPPGPMGASVSEDSVTEQLLSQYKQGGDSTSHRGHRQGCSEGSGAGDSANEVDSTSSTIAGTPATHSSVQRLSSRAEDEVVRDGSSDGRGLVAGDANSTAPSARPRRPRGRRKGYRLKTQEEYERDEHKKDPTPKKYFDFKSLEQLIQLVPFKQNLDRRARMEEQERRRCFLQFLQGLLKLDPEDRWTPTQARNHPFILMMPHDPQFQPVPDPSPEEPQRPRSSKVPGNTEPPSARTWHEISGRQASKLSGPESDQPRSAPATTQHRDGTSAVESNSTQKRDLLSEGAGPRNVGGVAASDVPDSSVHGFWGQWAGSDILPENNPADSYRPDIEQLPEEFFHNVAVSYSHRRLNNGIEQGKSANIPQKIRPGTSGSGASRSSDDTSTGSTPGGRGRRSLTSPQSLASSFSAGNRRVQNSGYRMDAKGSAIGRNQFAGTAAAHGSVLSHVPSGSTGTPNLGNPVAATGATSSTTGTVPAQQATPSANIQGNAQGPAPAPSQHRPGSGIRDYNRVSSPWHLPSPMSDFSTASDRVNSSLPSGSESCGENALQYVNGQYYECRSASEDPSHSDHVRSNQASDSDLSTPRSAEARVEEPHHDKQLPQQLSEKDIKSLITPLGLPRRLDQSPGATAINFREAVGMNENGPVIPARPAVAGAGAGNSGMPSLSAGQFGQSAGRRKARGGP
mmetsp:Transcript_23393/g.61444  ORF Transcript_23393/g.61444 Transcript_23393/m.61444 type:complete len:1064 (-) Transcript_23393:298-3489(-)